MEIKVNITKRYFYSILGILLIILVVLSVTAFNSGGPASNFGHSVDEVDWSKTIIGNIAVTGKISAGTQDIAIVNGLDITLGDVGSSDGPRGLKLYSNSNPAIVIPTNGNVGIGTTPGPYKLDVQGDIRVRGNTYFEATSNIDGAPGTYLVNNRRYHVEKTTTGTFPLDANVMNEFCKDEDGCTITLAAKDWSGASPGLTTSLGPFKLFLSTTTNGWKTSYLDLDGTDSVNGIQNIVTIPAGSPSCYFSDAEIYSGAGAGDNAVGFSLYDNGAGPAIKRCILDIED